MNLELRTALLALAQQTISCSQKRHRSIQEPNTFSGGSADDLWAFIFQYQIYFHVCEGEFKKDSEKIYFAILYLREIALDYFEPFINEPDLYQDMDFLKDWDAFVQKLSNIFRSHLPKDDDKNAIVAISFSPDGKDVTYFIQFTKYQNRICWDDHSLQKVVKDVISARISEELYFSKKDLSTFEGYKRAVLKIDNDHWKQVQEEKNRQWLACTLQGHLYCTPQPKL